MRNIRGFTLIEVLIAMIIMSGGIVVIATAWSGNAMRLERMRISSTVANLLQQKMTEIELLYREKGISEIKEEDAGPFGEAYPQFTWEMSSKEFEVPDLSGAMSARDGGVDPQMLMIVQKTTEFIRKAVREVTVTVIYTSKANGKQVKNSITTYFVDYQQSIASVMGDMGAPSSGGNNQQQGGNK